MNVASKAALASPAAYSRWLKFGWWAVTAVHISGPWAGTYFSYKNIASMAESVCMATVGQHFPIWQAHVRWP